MKYRIIKFKDDGKEYLTLAAPWKKKAEGFHAEEILQDPVRGLSATEMAVVLSQDAENANYHGLVGQYEKLSQICEDAGSAESARRIFEKIVEMGGLVD